MKQKLAKLFWAEFRRQWSLTTLSIPLLFMVIGGLITFMPSRFDKTFDVAQKLSNLLGFLATNNQYHVLCRRCRKRCEGWLAPHAAHSTPAASTISCRENGGGILLDLDNGAVRRRTPVRRKNSAYPASNGV